MKKRILPLLLALLMVFEVLPVSTLAEDTVLEPPACDSNCNTESVSGHQQTCAIKEYYREVYRTYSAAELYAMRDVVGQDAWAFIVSESWNLDNAKAMELKELIEKGETTEPTDPSEPTDPTEPEDSCSCCENCTGAEGCTCGCEDCTFCEPEVPTDPTDPSVPDDEVSGVVNGHTIVASGCLGDNAELIAEPGDPEKNAYLNQDLRSDLNVYAYNIDLIGEFTGSVALSIGGIPVAGSNELIEVLHLLDSAEAIEAAKEKGTAQGYAVPGLGDIFPEEVAASGEVDTIYYEVLSASRDAAGNVVFTTDSFSEFIIYTVDFHYKGINFSIPGGTGILLSELLQRLQIDKSIAGVTNVTFSNYELVSVTPENGDWRLTSLQPFTSTELLVLTFSDGEVYEITVTDEQRAAANDFLIQIDKDYWFQADLSTKADKHIYHPDYKHEDFVYVSPGKTFEVWRDTVYGIGVGVKLVDTNIWWRWNKKPETIKAVVHKGEAPDGSDSKTNILGNTFYYSYGGNNLTDDLRKATVTVSPNAAIGDDYTLTVCNGNSYSIDTPRGYRYARTGDPNTVRIRVAKQVQVTYNLNTDGKGGGGIHGTQTGYSTGTSSSSMKLKRLDAPAAPAGYTFGGWNTKADGSGTNYTAGSTFQPTSNTEYFAKWVPISYPVTFHHYYEGTTNQAHADTTASLPYGSTISVANYKQTVEHAEYVSSNPESLTISTTGNTATLYYRPDAGYTVTYQYTGTVPSGAPQLPETQTYWSGASVTVAANPSLTGYNFSGWSKSGSFSISSDTVITGSWTPITYTVKYDGNPSHDGVTADSTHTYNVAKTLTPNGYQRSGYKFVSWNAKADGTGTAYADQASVKNLTSTNGATVTLYAQWKPIYKITLDSQKQTEETANFYFVHTLDAYYSDHTCNTALAGNKIVPPTKNGYTFAGFYTQEGGKGTQYIDKNGNISSACCQLGQDTTLYAAWDAITYTITYQYNDSVRADATQTYDYETDVKLMVPERVGYKFLGWTNLSKGETTNNWKYANYDNAADGMQHPGYYQYGNVTLIARWEPITYKIQFAGGEGATGSMTEITATYDKDLTLPENEFQRIVKVTYDVNGGKNLKPSDTVVNLEATFKNWISGSKTYNDKDSVKNLATTQNAVVQLTAQWNLKSTTTPTVERDGYTFAGWKPEGTATDLYEANETITPPQDITLVAQWNPVNYTITYELGGGSWPNGATHPENYQITDTLNITDPIREGWKFTGWTVTGATLTEDENWDASYSSIQNLTNRYGSVKLTAKWDDQYRYELTYDANTTDAVSDMPAKVDTGWIDEKKHTFTLSGDPIRAGYDFLGWATSETATAADVLTSYELEGIANSTAKATLYAVWQRHTGDLKLTFNGGETKPAIVTVTGQGKTITLVLTKSETVIKDLPTGEYSVTVESGNASYTATVKANPNPVVEKNQTAVVEIEVNSKGLNWFTAFYWVKNQFGKMN